MFSCKKASFKSGTGLYSIKQYHRYAILSSGDTGKMSDTRISTIAADNNYLTWNNITFHRNFDSDTLQVYINDSAISGVTQILYTLNYYPKLDVVNVFNHPTTEVWRSF
jgi:hypothetical protein